MGKKLLLLALWTLWAVPCLAQSVDTAWVRRYYGATANAIAVDNSGNVYVTGDGYEDVTNYDYVTMKYCSNGDTAWIQRYNGTGSNRDAARDIAVDNLSCPQLLYHFLS
jgi:phosphoribosylformylglycinamidine (FGAM) synthase-like amidotransferase family enzyme